MGDIDREVAEKVMGWRKNRTHAHPSNPEFWFNKHGHRKSDTAGWSPSTRIDHAWEVVEKLSELWESVEVSKEGGEYRCGVNNGIIQDGSIGYQAPFEYAETAPLAICKTALEAVK